MEGEARESEERERVDREDTIELGTEKIRKRR